MDINLYALLDILNMVSRRYPPMPRAKIQFSPLPVGISIISLSYSTWKRVHDIYNIAISIFVENFNNCLDTYSFDSRHR